MKSKNWEKALEVLAILKNHYTSQPDLDQLKYVPLTILPNFFKRYPILFSLFYYLIFIGFIKKIIVSYFLSFFEYYLILK
jgi:hypothetical protein